MLGKIRLSLSSNFISRDSIKYTFLPRIVVSNVLGVHPRDTVQVRKRETGSSLEIVLHFKEEMCSVAFLLGLGCENTDKPIVCKRVLALFFLSADEKKWVYMKS